MGFHYKSHLETAQNMVAVMEQEEMLLLVKLDAVRTVKAMYQKDIDDFGTETAVSDVSLHKKIANRGHDIADNILNRLSEENGRKGALQKRTNTIHGKNLRLIFYAEVTRHTNLKNHQIARKMHRNTLTVVRGLEEYTQRCLTDENFKRLADRFREEFIKAYPV